MPLRSAFEETTEASVPYPKDVVLGASPRINSETQGEARIVADAMCKCTMGGFSRNYIAFMNRDMCNEAVLTLEPSIPAPIVCPRTKFFAAARVCVDCRRAGLERTTKDCLTLTNATPYQENVSPLPEGRRVEQLAPKIVLDDAPLVASRSTMMLRRSNLRDFHQIFVQMDRFRKGGLHTKIHIISREAILCAEDTGRR